RSSLLQQACACRLQPIRPKQPWVRLWQLDGAGLVSYPRQLCPRQAAIFPETSVMQAVQGYGYTATRHWLEPALRNDERSQSVGLRRGTRRPPLRQEDRSRRYRFGHLQTECETWCRRR